MKTGTEGERDRNQGVRIGNLTQTRDHSRSTLESV